MFTEYDIAEFCNEIASLERNMAALYQDAAARLTDPDLQKSFHGLARDEQAHEKIALELHTALTGKSTPP